MTVRTKVNYRKGVFGFLGSNIYLVIERGLGGLGGLGSLRGITCSKGSIRSMRSKGWGFSKI
jgi:hypothetical protein